MSAHYRTLKINLACIMLAAGLALPAGLGIGLAAEQPSPEDIIRALKPRAAHARSHRIARRCSAQGGGNPLREHPAQPAHPFAYNC